MLMVGRIAVLVSVVVLGARSLGLLEAFELIAYDAFIRLRPLDPSPHSRIALVIVTERDIAENDWPLSDDMLARIIETVARHGPRAVGLDIYRDVPVPPGTRRLEATLAAEPRVIAVMMHTGGGSIGVRPPGVLRNTDRVGFSDILVDPGGVVRRALLYMDDRARTYYSFSLRLALLYLKGQAVAPQAGAQNHLRLGRVTIRPLEANDGGYVRADARGYQFLMDFKDARRPFASVDLHDLLRGSFDSALFRDKIVLIGVDAESIQDHLYTPLSRGSDGRQSMPGVVVHAQAASQLVRIGLDADAPTRVLPGWQDGSWVLVWSIAGALLGFGLRSPWRLLLAASGGVVALTVIDFFGFVRGLWIPLVPPALAWLSATGVTTAYMSHRESVERALLMRLFSRHVSREVAETIWRNRHQFLQGGRPRPERLMVTVLFSDLAGFTTKAEKLTPETLLEWLNEYMDAMAREVSRYGGVIRQYAGDGIVAYFGIPIPRKTETEIDQDARNAVECALAMGAALRELNSRWRSEGRTTAGMRIGILTGPAVTGMLGSAERSEYVVEGDTVNTGSRLESFDKELLAPDPDTRPVRILIGETTLNRLGARSQTERIGEVSLRGKEQRVSVYHVIGRRKESAG
jgi:adenylate cyclase